MGSLNHIPSRFVGWINFLLLNFFSALFDMRNVQPIFDSLLRRFSGISFISTKMLNCIGTFNNNCIKHRCQLADIMSICSGYDYRERDTTLVHQKMSLGAVFSPCLSGYDQRSLEQVEL